MQSCFRKLIGMGKTHSSFSGNAIVNQSQVTKLSASGDLQLWALNIIEYCSWKERGEIAKLSKQWNHNTKSIHYFRFLCQRLAVEHGLYVPLSPPPNESWRLLFLELFRLRHLWKISTPHVTNTSSYEDLQLTATNQFKERFKISVYAKFRPLEDSPRSHSSANASSLKHSPKGKKVTNSKTLSTSGTTSPSSSPSRSSVSGSTSDKENEKDENAGHEVTLPLHQRLAMIRMSHHIQNNRVALKVLTEEGGWFRDKWQEISNDANHGTENKKGGEKVFTAQLHGAQKHPNWKTFKANMTSGSSKGGGDQSKMVSKVHSIDSMNGRVIMLTPDVGLREFSFDGVLPPTVSQKFTYDVCMKRLVMDMLNGFNATAIVYGQTGSGKTFSMFGRDESSIYGKDREGKGIVPRACEEILAALQRRRELNGIESTLSVSYVEIYGDQITDLLKNGSRCSHSKVSSQRFVLNGAAEQVVEGMDDISELLYRGEQTKRRAATAMNDRSTRAHSLFILTLRQKAFKGSQVTIQSKLFLADLGGSEQVKKSQVEAGIFREGLQSQFSLGFEMGVHMREAVYINLGLLALKRCIEALNNRCNYVPFQDSKLTMLLSEGIGGNSKTSIIICANQHPVHAHETVMTLRFGERCALIENSLRNNATMLQQILDNLDQEISELEKIILQKERWEIKEEKVVDELAEEGTIEMALGGQEIKKIAVVVGAEEERKRLALLLLQKEQLFGKSVMASAMDSFSAESSSENLFMIDDSMTDSNTNYNRRSRKPVLGFGKQYAEIYGVGAMFDEKLEDALDNSRFDEKISMEELPMVIKKSRVKKLTWATGEKMEESQELLEKKAMKVKRNKLAFSGLSF